MSPHCPRPNRPFPWVLCLVALGLGFRCYHYLINPSMWHDEAALVLNVLNKGFGDLLGPLLFSEAAPPLFLWVERAVVLILGDGTYALRLVPFLASCSALVLMVPLARRLVSPEAVPWAVMLFAFSDQLLWHASEAKPYAVDVLAAVLLTLLFCTTSSWALTRRLVLFTTLAPVVIFLSYPGSFLYGGLLLAFLPGVWRNRRLGSWLGYGALAMAVFASFTLLALGPAHAQRDTAILSCWERCFPDWERPWTIPHWMFLSTLEVCRYCCEPMGQANILFVLIGTACLWRRGTRTELVLLLVPVALALVASFLRAYPYAGARVLVYASPALLALMAEGVPPVLAWIRQRTRVGTLVAWVVLLAPVGRVVQHVVLPRVRADCAGAAAFVLANRRESDAVAANHWEYMYYFRHLGDTFTTIRQPLAPAGARLWLVITDAEESERLGQARQAVSSGWEMLECRHFARTTVFLMQPTQPSDSGDVIAGVISWPLDGQ